ncbi:protein neuralized-like isoform X2 [Crassostrea virginica]
MTDENRRKMRRMQTRPSSSLIYYCHWANPGHSTGDLASTQVSLPVKFHKVHGDNVILLNDNTIAQRGDSFCKAICFSSRPIAINEKVYIRFAKTSSSWSGVLRFGFTNIDPGSVRGSDLPRYACPDMTNKQGCWAKALGERYAAFNNVLHFYVTRNGDVIYGINGEDIGLFFSGVSTLSPLWTLLDIYGNTIGIEFVSQERLSDGGPLGSLGALNNVLPPPIPQRESHPSGPRTQFPTSSLGNLHSDSITAPAAPSIPIRYYSNINFRPMSWHELSGKNIRVVDANRTIAVRADEEYCNAYVFSSRPLKCGEKIVIQVLGIERSFIGGLAVGFTACDPREVTCEDLPDDSDMLLDRKEYWVVNKDVCRTPEVGDELCFHLTLNGEVRYSKNNTKVATLMHVDKTLPLWLFFDVYGNIQKIRSIGVTTHVPPIPPRPRSTPFMTQTSMPQLTVTLPPREQNTAQVVVNVPTPASSGSTTQNSGHPNYSMMRSYSVPTGVTSPVSMSEQQNPTHIKSLPTSPETTMDSCAESEASECTVCYERSVNAVLYTCGHMCMCFECAIVVKNHKSALCPICRQEIKDVIKIYKT